MALVFTIDCSDPISLIANISAITTAVVAVVWFFKNKIKEYFATEVPGNYKIFKSLKGSVGSIGLIHLNINHIDRKGWFYGFLDYGQPFEFPGARSEGFCNVVGKLNYSYSRSILGYLWRVIRLKKFHPLDIDDFGSFHGKIYFLSRNDFDVSITDWRHLIIQECSIIQYRSAYRLKIHKPVFVNSYLQIPDEFVMVNVDKIPDPMFHPRVS